MPPKLSKMGGFFYVGRTDTRNITVWVNTSIHADCNTSDVNDGANNSLLHGDKAVYSYT